MGKDYEFAGGTMRRAWEVDSYDGATGHTWKLRCMYLLKDVVNAPRLRWKEGHHGGRGVVVMGAPP